MSVDLKVTFCSWSWRCLTGCQITISRYGTSESTKDLISEAIESYSHSGVSINTEVSVSIVSSESENLKLTHININPTNLPTGEPSTETVT